jgi:lipid II:glycine glycyltransferase (peptidoglycan interpeptide bridge formation enzyme)
MRCVLSKSENMLEIERKTFVFKNKEIWFADCPYDVEGCDSVSFMQCKRKVDLAEFACYDFDTLVIDLTQSLDAIWGNIRKSCRNEINRAVREGIKVRINENFDEFYEMNKSFRRKKGLAGKVLPSEFMKRYGTLFTTELNHEVLSGILWLEDETNIRGLQTASKRFDAMREKAIMAGYANRLMWWESIKYAKEKGIKECDLGGYYTGENKNDPRYTINIFKQSFGGQLVTRYNYYKVYSRTYKLARSMYRRARALMYLST